MKKFIFLSLTALFAICSYSFFTIPKVTTSAEVQYLRVITEQTPFYKNATDSQPLFYLPYTYYVKVLDDDGAFVHAEISISDTVPALDGYVPSQMLFSDGLIVNSPYPQLKLKTVSTALLFEDASLSTPIQYVFTDRNMEYLGSYTHASGNVYYVSYNNRLGYVKESDVYPFQLQNHPNELTFIEPEPEPLPDTPEQEEQTENNLLSVKVIIIICLVFAGIIGLIFAVKTKPRKGTAITYYDENDYE